MSQNEGIEEARLEISSPTVFTTLAVLEITAVGFLSFIPILVAIAAISLLKLSVFTWIVPLVGAAISACFPPSAFENRLIAKKLRRRLPADRIPPGAEPVQLTLTPRIRTGLRAVVEDADDFGFLGFTGTGLVFSGDSVQLSIPFQNIQEIGLKNVGFRGLFEQRLSVWFRGSPVATSAEFTERTSWLVPASRRKMRALYERLSQARRS